MASSRIKWVTVSQNENYEVNSLAQVRNKKTGHVLKYDKKITGGGYYNCSLGRRGCAMVHTLVCTAFHGHPPSKRHQVNHKDGNKLNNRAENLEWVTPKQNMQHALKSGRLEEHRENMSRRSTGEGNPKAKLTERDVLRIKDLIVIGWNRSRIAELYLVSNSTVGSIELRKTWKHLK